MPLAVFRQRDHSAEDRAADAVPALAGGKLDVAKKNRAPVPSQADAADVGGSARGAHDHRIVQRRVAGREMRALPCLVPAPGHLDVVAHRFAMQLVEEPLVVAVACTQRIAAERGGRRPASLAGLNPPCHACSDGPNARPGRRRCGRPRGRGPTPRRDEGVAQQKFDLRVDAAKVACASRSSAVQSAGSSRSRKAFFSAMRQCRVRSRAESSGIAKANVERDRPTATIGGQETDEQQPRTGRPDIRGGDASYWLAV